MKRGFLLKTVVIIVFCNVMVSCEGQDESPPPELPGTNLLGDFWFGYYKEDPVTNPEDPGIGLLYMKIPESGNFDGELYFSRTGCTSGIDIGRVTGTAENEDLDGSWSGNVDGRNVGGPYTGQLVGQQQYQGTYINAGGKVEIECSEDFVYFVAPKGTWLLNSFGNNETLNITVDTDSDPIVLSWNGNNQPGLIYNVVIIDAECLDENLELEECLVWSGLTTTNSIVYGEGIDDTPADELIIGRSYLAVITCVNSSGEATVSNNIIFVR